MKIAINLPAELKTMTAKEFINRFGVCDEAKKWLRKIGLNHSMEFFWNRCARRGWLQYILYRDFIDEWKKIEHLLNGKEDAFGWTIDWHEAQRFRNAIEINWVEPKLKKDEAFICVYRTYNGAYSSPFIDPGVYRLDDWNDISNNRLHRFAFRSLKDARNFIVDLAGDIEIFKAKVRGIKPYNGDLPQERRCGAVNIDAFKLIEQVG